MKPYMLALTGLVLALGCSSQDGEQRVAADADLAPPLEVARVDTSQPALEAEPQIQTPATSKAKPAPRKARRPARKSPADTEIAVAPKSKEDTSTVQGYAPDANADKASTDTLEGATAPGDTTTTGVFRADTASPVVSDTEATAPPIVDTVPSPVIDSAVASTDAGARPVDTVATAPRDTVSTAVADTMVGRDTAPISRDTAPVSRDTAPVRRDTAAASPAPARPATSAGATSTAAARTLPIGTQIHAALDDSINSRKDTVGRTVTAVVTENITGSDGKTLIAAGSPVRLTVTRLSPSRSKGSQGRLRLKVEGIGIGHELRPVTAEVQAVPHELRGRGVTAGDAAKVGVGAAGGAVLGKVIGKDTKGAVIGGVIGAAGGAVVASQTATRDVFVKARTPVVLKLTQPLVVQ